VILERGIGMLKDGGRLAFVVPDGMLNNQGELSNCPRVRRLLAESGRIEAIVSLPDFAFRKAGAQNKTSILFFRKFTSAERAAWRAAYEAAVDEGAKEGEAHGKALEAVDYEVFLAEATHIGYTPTGVSSGANDLYWADGSGFVADDQKGSILGELRRFRDNPQGYDGHRQPDCTSMKASELWTAHPSHRLDPKYFLFKAEEQSVTPTAG
jgi:type I restriction enzyme M protein